MIGLKNIKSLKASKRIALIGGGPAALFMYKRIIDESSCQDVEIDIYERKNHLGMGMPYSYEGANDEHVTNVSDNEIPELPESVSDWI